MFSPSQTRLVLLLPAPVSPGAIFLTVNLTLPLQIVPVSPISRRLGHLLFGLHTLHSL